MKFAVILPDGAHDVPLAALGGLTPLAAARHPHLDEVVRAGQIGRTVTIPAGFTPGTDVGTLSLFGYDPHVHYSGRAPIEAAAKHLAVRPDQLVFRCNFVVVREGVMRDNTGGHITQDEADALVAALQEELADQGCTVVAGVTYRNLLLLDDAADLDISCAPPHDILDQPIAGHLPRGGGAARLLSLTARADAIVARHPVNARRRERGQEPISGIWLWGQGRPTQCRAFSDRFGLRAAAITAVDILRGLAVLTGMDLIEVPGATGFLDTDYDAKGRAAVAALDSWDLVIVHVEAADEAAHMGNAAEKVRALERIDEAVVGPVLARLRQFSAWRILVAADHATLTTTRGHSAIPPLFAWAGTGIPAEGRGGFDEASAESGGLWIREGHRLMEMFLAE
jgi:2,3-bisphosphoglycerate-independent phosphoglycerate mutase